MKNAMKKLTSLLLVAVLLVGAIPFGAFAAEFDPTAFLGTSSEVAEAAAEPAPASLDSNNDVAAASLDSSADVAAAAAPEARAATNPIAFDLIITYADGTVNTIKCSMAAGTTAYEALCSALTKPVADDLLAKNDAAILNDVVASGMGSMRVTFTKKEVATAMDNVFLKISDTSTVGKQVFARGTVLQLNKNLVVNTYGLTLPVGHEITYFTVGDQEVKGQYTVASDNVEIVVHTALTGTANGGNGGSSNNGGSTASYVDVILVNDNRTSGFAANEYHHCVLQSGKISQADRDAITAKMPAGTVAWKRGDNGTQSNSLLNFDFSGLQSPINIFPVVQTAQSGSTSNGTGNSTLTTTGTVVFKNYNGGNMYTAPITNGKLTNQDVINATNAANRSGYTFGGWKINGAGTAAASDLLLNMTFNNGDYLVPVYTANPPATTTPAINPTKNQNDIFLNIFVNKDFQHCKTIKLNDHWVISDDKITKDEILQYVVTDYYKASNGNLGLQADKLYYSVGSFMYNWLTDNGTSVIDNITTKRSQGTVTVNIMVTNAVAKNGAAADKSNPKTGDEIYTAMTVMGLSAASLAAVMFFYNKKRYTV